MAVPESFRVLDEEVIRVGGSMGTYGRGQADRFRIADEPVAATETRLLDGARLKIDAGELTVLQEYLAGKPVQSLAVRCGGETPLLNVVRTALDRLRKALA